MSARAALRAATAAEHERVDRLFSTADLAAIDGYRRFLVAQAAAFLPIEAALEAAGAAQVLPDWPQRRRSHLLRADLAALGATEPEPVAPPPFANDAAILGGIYVLEGSRLGGAMLKRGVAAEAPAGFLSAPQEPASWRKLLENLDRVLYGPDQIEAAVGAARTVFEGFAVGGLRHLETAKA